jgi:Fic family protein
MNSGNYQKYIWQKAEWPQWSFNSAVFSQLLSQVNLERGRLLGSMQALGFNLAEKASLKVLTCEVVKSSEIEGERLNPEAVRSSIARRLGIEVGGLIPSDKHVDGVVDMVIDATRDCSTALTQERLFGWHAALFSTGHTGMFKIAVASYRDDTAGTMQVVSSSIGREKVHYEAPSATVIQTEMAQFLDWFNSELGLDPVIKAGLAHLWFVTLHPFDDGNGRIGRAICDVALARADGSPQRFYSLSAQMQREREDYYNNLEKAQRSTLDVTAWLTWFLGCLLRAVQSANEELKGVVYLANLSHRLPSGKLNERQKKVLNMMIQGFNGNLTTGKWAKIAQCSTDTALRDIGELVELGVLLKAGESKRATHYALNEF